MLAIPPINWFNILILNFLIFILGYFFQGLAIEAGGSAWSLFIRKVKLFLTNEMDDREFLTKFESFTHDLENLVQDCFGGHEDDVPPNPLLSFQETHALFQERYRVELADLGTEIIDQVEIKRLASRSTELTKQDIERLRKIHNKHKDENKIYSNPSLLKNLFSKVQEVSIEGLAQ